MDPYSIYLHDGETVIYEARTMFWGMERTGKLIGPALTADQAQAINNTEGLSLSCPDIRVGAPPGQVLTLTPTEVCIRKPVQEEDTTVKFMYTGERRAPNQT